MPKVLQVTKVLGQGTNKTDKSFGVVCETQLGQLLISFPYNQLPQLKAFLGLSEQKIRVTPTTFAPDSVDISTKNGADTVFAFETPNDKFAVVLTEKQVALLRKRICSH